MHKSHLVGCAIGIALALVVVGLSGGSAGSLGVLVAALACPLAMVVAMWALMRHGEHGDAEPVAGRPADAEAGPVR